jgi:hypothetical protein
MSASDERTCDGKVGTKQPAKTTLFAGCRRNNVSKKAPRRLFPMAQRSRQKPRFLPAATKLLSEKSASATFFQWHNVAGKSHAFCRRQRSCCPKKAPRRLFSN